MKKKEETAIVTVNYLLETEAGFSSDECVDAIKSAPLKKAVLSYRKAATSREKANWDVAKACFSMKEDATKKEFGSDATLASFLGLANKGAFNKLRRIGAYYSECMEHNIPVTTAIELLPLEKLDKDGKHTTIPAALREDGLEGLTKMEVREFVKDRLALMLKDEKSAEGEAVETEDMDGSVYADADADGVNENSDAPETSWKPIILIDDDVYAALPISTLNKLRKLADIFCDEAMKVMKIEDAAGFIWKII